MSNTKHMYLAMGKYCPKATFFDVPHQEEPMSAKEILKLFPNFAKEMDGSAVENCLSFFYKKDKERNVYAFIDVESEEEVAELMGVELYDESKGEGPTINSPLTDEQQKEFREHIQDIRDGLKKIE